MNKEIKILVVLVTLLFNGGCTLVNRLEKPNTKEYILKDISEKLTKIEPKINLLNSEAEYEGSSEDIINLTETEDTLEVTNLKSPVNSKAVFRSDLTNVKNNFDKQKVKISIEEMPLNKFISLIFTKILDVNFVLDKSIEKSTQPVSLNIKDKIGKDKLFDIVLNILDEFNVAINIEKDIFYIKASTQRVISAQGMYIGNSLPSNLSDNSVILMMKPYYYSTRVRQYTDLVKSYFLSKNATLTIDRGEHFIRIKDKVKNIRKALKFYEFLDKPSMHNKRIKLVKMNYMDAESFIEEVTPIIKSYGINVSELLIQPGVKMVPIKQINSFILISDNSSWINTVLLWKKKLDRPIKRSVEESGFFVYMPQNRKAEELVSIIHDFISSSSDAPLDNNTTDISASDDDSKKSLLSNELKVVLDKERNNIIIQSTQNQFLEISQMLKKLDTLPKQILIEVTIAEVTLRDSMQFGLEWFLKTRGSNYGLALNALGAGSAGIAGVLTATSGDFGLNFNALQTNKYVNVLSNPKLLVLNNHTGTISVGNQVPIVSSQATAPDISSTSATPSILQNIEYRNTGIQLSVSPTINSEGYLTLIISQNVSNAQTNDTSDISSPLIFDRSLSTEVILKSGEMVVLGGLITENKSSDETQLPFLGSIPILGKLFSTSGDSIDKTELVIMVKPTILRSSNDTRVITDALLDIIDFK